MGPIKGKQIPSAEDLGCEGNGIKKESSPRLSQLQDCPISAQGPHHWPGMLVALSVVHSATWLNDPSSPSSLLLERVLQRHGSLIMLEFSLLHNSRCCDNLGSQ